jgi:copper homeostasis protein
MTKNKREALEQLIACGFDRVLTSGGQKKAVEGKELLRELNAAASGRIVILPGGGVNADCIAELARDTRLPEYHISARKFTPGEMEFRYAEMQISSDVQDDYRRLTVDPQEVERIRSIAEEIFYA